MRGGGVGVVCSRHRDNAALMRKGILREAVGGEFAVDGLRLGGFGAIAAVATLSHEAIHYSVESEAVIETACNELFEVVAGVGGVFGVKLNNEAAAVLHSELNAVPR